MALVLYCDDGEPQPWRNHPPRPPSVSGPDETYVGMPTGFQVTVYDPDMHSVVVFVAWGDGDTSDYPDFVGSGQTVTFEHVWNRADTFLVTARCYDTYDPRQPLFSDWSSPQSIVVRRQAALKPIWNHQEHQENEAGCRNVKEHQGLEDSAHSSRGPTLIE